jgi:hypothetical protein
MLWSPFPQNNNGKPRSFLVVAIIFGVLIAVGVVMLIAHLGVSTEQDRVVAAARKQNPNAKVSQIRVAGGFAIASVSDPTALGQLNSGNVTIFKENKDRSMTQIASGSYFSPLSLLSLGMPLSTQAKLGNIGLGQVKQNLASMCGYSGGDTPGYVGFDGSFEPSGWQIDSATLDDIEQGLTAATSGKNARVESGQKVICINATQRNSNITTDRQTYISTFTLELQFVTSNGTISTHTLTFNIGPRHYRNYELDGQKIILS